MDRAVRPVHKLLRGLRRGSPGRPLVQVGCRRVRISVRVRVTVTVRVRVMGRGRVSGQERWLE